MAWPLQPEGESETGESSPPVAIGRLEAGDTGAVRHLNGGDEAILRLMERALISGMVVEVSGVTPLGDSAMLTPKPHDVSMGGYGISTGNSEAQRIEVDRLS